ncbi:transposase [Mesorhizobium sp. M0220]|uniref:transposase n=1 Tax=Mesorhizobium sp. M0220 TaxID=2956920 RepID=UPI0033393556
MALMLDRERQHLVDEAADDIRTRRALEHKPVLRGYVETRYKAKSWKTERRACARIEATNLGLDIRFRRHQSRQRLRRACYDVIYCPCGQAENLIKSQLASDRTSCRSPIANQVRLILHTAAYWLMLILREAVPTTHHLRNAEFATLRLRLLKLGAHVSETVSRIRLAFAVACPEASLFRAIAITLQPAAAMSAGASKPQ